MKKIVVLGAGAIGSTFAALLSAQNEVTLIGRKNHIQKINKSGLLVKGALQKRIFVKGKTEIDSIEKDTLLLLCVKAHETEGAINAIKDKIQNDTIILCIQNGIGSDSIVRNIVKCRVVRALTLMSAIFTTDGSVEVTSIGNTFIPENEDDIFKIFTDSGIPVTESFNIQEQIWEKLTINCVINGLGTILRVRNNELTSSFLTNIKKQIISECIAVAKGEGISLDKSIAEKIEKVIAASDNLNSTLQDIIKHKSTEVDFLNGVVVELGRKHEIKTPINETIWYLIKTLESYEK